MYTKPKSDVTKVDLKSDAVAPKMTGVVSAAEAIPLHQQGNIGAGASHVLPTPGRRKLSAGRVGTGATDLPRHKFDIPDGYPFGDSGEVFVYKKMGNGSSSTEGNQLHQDRVSGQSHETTPPLEQRIRLTRGCAPAAQPPRLFHPVKIPHDVKATEPNWYSEKSSGCTMM